MDNYIIDEFCRAVRNILHDMSKNLKDIPVLKYNEDDVENITSSEIPQTKKVCINEESED